MQLTTEEIIACIIQIWSMLITSALFCQRKFERNYSLNMNMGKPLWLKALKQH
jgi:hypothetical protein